MTARAGAAGSGLIMGGFDRHGRSSCSTFASDAVIYSKLGWAVVSRSRAATSVMSYVSAGAPDAGSNRRSGVNLVRNMSKTGAGNFFEDFRIGQVIKHATRAP
jgi:hypothetical protein